MGLASERSCMGSFNMAELKKKLTKWTKSAIKQSEVFEIEQNVVRRRTNGICTCVLWWRLKQQLLHKLELLSFLPFVPSRLSPFTFSWLMSEHWHSDVRRKTLLFSDTGNQSTQLPNSRILVFSKNYTRAIPGY